MSFIVFYGKFDLMIKKFLKAVNEEEEIILDSLQAQISDCPNIAWYPSAGDDFRDLIEINRTKIDPDIFFHTDYNSNWVKLQCGLVFNDERTKVFIDRVTELKFRKKINYVVNHDYVDFPEQANSTPKIYLLDLIVESGFGVIRKPVVYFFMENINFLDEILLKYKINLSHFIKVREGCAWGGNRKSISLAYAFLGELQVKYLLIDNEEHTDRELINTISQKHNINPKKYELKNASQRRNISNWSGLSVKVLDVILSPEDKLSNEDFEKILIKIKSY
jgi:hypothetical protein